MAAPPLRSATNCQCYHGSRCRRVKLLEALFASSVPDVRSCSLLVHDSHQPIHPALHYLLLLLLAAQFLNGRLLSRFGRQIVCAEKTKGSW
jgi:hypothetical protein